MKAISESELDSLQLRVDSQYHIVASDMWSKDRERNEFDW